MSAGQCGLVVSQWQAGSEHGVVAEVHEWLIEVHGVSVQVHVGRSEAHEPVHQVHEQAV